MNNRWTKKYTPLYWLKSYLFFSWTKRDMILKLLSAHGRSRLVYVFLDTAIGLTPGDSIKFDSFKPCALIKYNEQERFLAPPTNHVCCRKWIFEQLVTNLWNIISFMYHVFLSCTIPEYAALYTWPLVYIQSYLERLLMVHYCNQDKVRNTSNSVMLTASNGVYIRILVMKHNPKGESLEPCKQRWALLEVFTLI
jgi:hypothetical protein